jgi:hypothetical protein
MYRTTRRRILRDGLITTGLSIAANYRIAARAANLGGDPTDLPFIDRFGPVGTVDDTATFNVAAQSGEPFRLRARSYNVGGPVTINPDLFVMRGIAGASRILCNGLEQGFWFRLRSTGIIDVHGVVWDGGGRSTGSAPGAIEISGSPEQCALRSCGVLRGSGAAGLLVYLTPAGSDDLRLVLEQIEAGSNVGSGIWIEHAVNVVCSGLRLHDNGANGVRLNRFADRAGMPIQRVTVRDSFAWRNGNAGFYVGAYNEGGAGQPTIAGPNVPDAVDVDLGNLFAWHNGGYGIAVQGQRVHVSDCHTSNNGRDGGIDCNALHCEIHDCIVQDERGFGIDIGGSSYVDVARCRVMNVDGVGLNVGGSHMVTGSGNEVMNCTREAIYVANVEYGGGQWLQYRCSGIQLIDTTIDISRMKSQYAIVVPDGAQGILFDGLEVTAMPTAGSASALTPVSVLYAVTDTIAVRRARFNGNAKVSVIPSAGILTIPDMAETVVLPPKPQIITKVQTNTAKVVGSSGIAWIIVTNAGAGYAPDSTTAKLTGDGDIDSVGKLVPQVWLGNGGQVMGIQAPRPGNGFTRAGVELSGRGSGAAAKVQIGVPIPRDRRLRIIFPSGGRLAGDLPSLELRRDNVVELMEFEGRWIVAYHG